MEQIKNSQITVEIADHGAELVSMKDAHGKEYLWQADPKYWGRHSPILFPIQLSGTSTSKIACFSSTLM